jgi:hypothetical protein
MQRRRAYAAALLGPPLFTPLSYTLSLSSLIHSPHDHSATAFHFLTSKRFAGVVVPEPAAADEDDEASDMDSGCGSSKAGSCSNEVAPRKFSVRLWVGGGEGKENTSARNFWKIRQSFAGHHILLFAAKSTSLYTFSSRMQVSSL